MLKHLLIEVIGHFSGLSDAQVEQIERSLPATKALIDLLSKARAEACTTAARSLEWAPAPKSACFQHHRHSGANAITGPLMPAMASNPD